MTEEESSIERLKKKLNMRGENPVPPPRRSLRDEAYPVSDDWKEEITTGVVGEDKVSILLDKRVSARMVEKERRRSTGMRLVRNFFIVSFLFFLISAGLTVYFFTIGKNQVSCDKMDIVVTGPSSIASGKELSLSVRVLNKNNTALEGAKLVVAYPEGARNPDNASVPLPASQETIGSLASGEAVRSVERVLLFGQEKTEQTIGISLEYKIPGSGSTFSCQAPYKVLIATSPVALAVDGFQEVASGQDIALTVTVTSNSGEVVPNLRLVAEYPFGFRFTEANPKPTTDTNVWDIGDIAPGTKQTIVLKGLVSAQSTEARSIRFRLGERDSAHPQDIVTTLQALERPITIARPFLALNLSVNGSTKEAVPIQPHSVVHAVLSWKNTLPYALYDVALQTQLPTGILPETVVVKEGYYRSQDNTILWTPQTIDRLRTVEPGAQGEYSFSFTVGAPDITKQNQSLSLAFDVKARRVSDTVPQEQTLKDQALHTLQFISSLTLDSSALFKAGPFVNVGTHPPQVDKETTYTVVWDIANTTNDVDDVSVSAKVPVYAKFLGTVSPESEKVVYNASTNEITWTAGGVSAGTGSRLQKRSVAFQMSIVPGVGERGKTLPILLSPVMHGKDRFTGSVLEKMLPDQTTVLSKDPLYATTDSRVL